MSPIDRLWQARPRSRFLHASIGALIALAAFAWLFGDLEIGAIFGAGRRANVERFLRDDIVPPAVREHGAGALPGWAWPLFRDRGLAGLGATLAIAVLAIVLAAAGGLALTLPGARTFMSPQAWLPHSSAPSGTRRFAWATAVAIARAFQLFLRSIPEYIWAFLFLAILGPNAWPAVLALAIHNAGILGKLGSETVENLESPALRSLRGLGASRAQVAVTAIFPAAFGRFLLYFFYRFETCVRDATALGMLGVVSLGYWIADARAKRFYDEMLFYVLLGAVIVLVADFGSAAARRAVRRAA